MRRGLSFFFFRKLSEVTCKTVTEQSERVAVTSYMFTKDGNDTRPCVKIN